MRVCQFRHDRKLLFSNTLLRFFDALFFRFQYLPAGTGGR